MKIKNYWSGGGGGGGLTVTDSRVWADEVLFIKFTTFTIQRRGTPNKKHDIKI